LCGESSAKKIEWIGERSGGTTGGGTRYERFCATRQMPGMEDLGAQAIGGELNRAVCDVEELGRNVAFPECLDDIVSYTFRG